MQSGEIKYWNQDKGYGFINVDNQSEDVFFHVSKVRLSQPITVGQKVYFNSERNAENQLRATELTSSSLSIQDDIATDVPKRSSDNTSHNHHSQNTQSHQHSQNSRRDGQSQKSPFSTLFILVAIIAVAVYFFGDLKSTFFAGSAESATLSQSSSDNLSPTATAGITGDRQIDDTITLIQQGGPYPYPNKDGTTFYNREGTLPAQSQGYYREYTVPTPGLSHRGARRIVTGGNPPTVYYLTVDHYESFSQLQVK
ncbi:ribonuclease domain-containing protein [Psychrobacter immobilis]|uniref:ribonuclease domain-containing protein n=1 Tax=Psychrobacter immobilis TaxID=498 RepID=UPI00191A5E4B|nr:ribonuclease domain-containing protein [Psychrobacter immobilis]